MVSPFAVRLRVIALRVWVFAALVLMGAGLGAHPLGMSSVNRYVGVDPRAAQLEIDYLLDLAELPAYAEIERIDVDHDERITPQERDRFLDRMVPGIARGLDVRVNGVRVALAEVGRTLEAPPGQNGLSTLRVAVIFAAPWPGPEARVTVQVRDAFRPERPGWREIDAVPGGAARVVSSSLPATLPRAGPSLVYPEERPDGRGLPQTDEATFVFDRSEAAQGESAGAAVARGVVSRRGAASESARLVAMLRAGPQSLSAALLSLALALLLGASHALSPGHGKAMVGAWLVGSRGTVRHALLLGLAITLSHTASVFALALLALAIERTVGTEKLVKTLELAAGALIVAVALAQLPGRWRRFRQPSSAAGHAHDGGAHSHAVPERLDLRGLVLMGVSGGVVPCPGALVLLLAALSLGKLLWGIGLLVAFSAGLAAVLSLVGAAAVLGRRWLDRFEVSSKALRVLPVLSSAAVSALGAALVLRALLR